MSSQKCNGKIVRKLGKYLEIETDHPFETLKLLKVQPMNCRHAGDVFKSGEIGDEVALNYVSAGQKGDWHAVVTKTAPKVEKVEQVVVIKSEKDLIERFGTPEPVDVTKLLTQGF